MNIKPIKTDDDYNKALEEIRNNFHVEDNTPKGDYLDVLVTLVEAYEREHFPIPAPDPVEALNYFIESRGLSRSQLAKLLGPRSRVTEVLNYQRGLSLRMIRNLHGELGIPADVLINEYELKKSYEPGREDTQIVPLLEEWQKIATKCEKDGKVVCTCQIQNKYIELGRLNSATAFQKTIHVVRSQQSSQFIRQYPEFDKLLDNLLECF